MFLAYLAEAYALAGRVTDGLDTLREAFDFVAGVTKRAPLWMRRLGLEWLHRLLREPWRWRRMMALPRFCWLLLRESTR